MAVTTSTTITSVGYNDIQSKINTVLSTNYGYTGVYSVPVTTGTTITSAQWFNLYVDINRCIVHQTGVKLSPTLIGTYNYSSDQYENVVLTAATVNTLDDYATQALANSTQVAANQLAVNSDNGTSTVTATWGNNRRHRVRHTWSTADYARYFFNLGGNIRVRLSYTPGNYSGQDAIWQDLIDAINVKLSTQGYGPTDFITGLPVTPITESSGANSITVNFSKISATQTLTEVVLLDPDAIPSDIDITSTVEYHYSIKLDVALPAGGGVPTPALPQTEKVLGLDNTTGSGLTVTKILSVTPTPITITMPSGTTSTSLVTMTNSGNTAMGIGRITANLPAGSGLSSKFYEESWDTTKPLTLEPNQSVTMKMSYYNSIRQGTFNTILVIVADNDVGFVTTPVNITVTEPVFDFTFLPAAISKTATNGSLVSQVFSYVANTTYDTNYADPVLTQDYNYFTMTVNRAARQVTLTFNPLVRKINGTYSASVSLTLVGNRTITRSITFTVTRNLNDQSRNLGTWISAKSAINSVIGMSYDIIEGKRYITMGVGVQGTPSATILSDGLTPVTVDNLGITADDKYSNGTVLYKVPTQSAYCQFLNDYGVWVRPNTDYPTNITLTRYYKFTAPTTGRFSWEFAADNVGSFNIDGGTQLNATSSLSTSEVGLVTLAAGPHTINLQILNSSGPGSIAIVIKAPDGTQVWSTRTPVRTADPYPNWSEVYRIPLPGGRAVTYQSNLYCIKDTAAARPDDGNEAVQFTRWGDFFGTPNGNTSKSLFTVVDDGIGNLAITLNGKTGTATNTNNYATTSNLPYSSYYYSTRGTRYTQLESTPINANGVVDSTGIYTHQFTGFDLNGVVTTIIAEYPKPDQIPVSYVPTTGYTAGPRGGGNHAVQGGWTISLVSFNDEGMITTFTNDVTGEIAESFTPSTVASEAAAAAAASEGAAAQAAAAAQAISNAVMGQDPASLGAAAAAAAAEGTTTTGNTADSGTTTGNTTGGGSTTGGNVGTTTGGTVSTGTGSGFNGTAPTCFVKGVLVTLASGEQIAIEDVKVGDFVLGQTGPNQVIAHDRPQLIIPDVRDGTLYGFNGSAKFITAEHPVMTRSGWKAIDQDNAKRFEPHLSNILIGNLAIGDEILCKDGSYIMLDSIEKYEDQPQQQLYNLMLDNDHTYYVNDLLVHNKDGGDGTSAGCTCYLAGSSIAMADGRFINIEDVKVGDQVLGAFGEINEILALMHVKLGNRKMYKINQEHDTTYEEIHISSDKKMYSIDNDATYNEYGVYWNCILGDGTEKMLMNVGVSRERLHTLTQGTELHTITGPRVVNSLNAYDLPSDTTLYNFVLNGSHTFFVNEYAVSSWPREDDFEYDTWTPKITTI